jgi:hypothetical protein
MKIHFGTLQGVFGNPASHGDFEARVYHPGAGVWMHFGCQDGEPSFEESADEDG